MKTTDLISREMFPPDPVGGPFKTVVIDPPWKYGDKLPGPGRGAEKHYSTLSQDELLWMSHLVDFKIADDAHIYIWTTNSFVQEAYELMAWFDAEHKTNITWVKVKKGQGRSEIEPVPDQMNQGTQEKHIIEEADVRMGMGHSWRGATEHCLFGVRGRQPALVHNLHNVIIAEQGRHSEKPRAFYEKVEQISPGPYLDIFARGQGRLNWTGWGDEVEY